MDDIDDSDLLESRDLDPLISQNGEQFLQIKPKEALQKPPIGSASQVVSSGSNWNKCVTQSSGVFSDKSPTNQAQSRPPQSDSSIVFYDSMGGQKAALSNFQST